MHPELGVPDLPVHHTKPIQIDQAPVLLNFSRILTVTLEDPSRKGIRKV